ncbi:hypothetical protein A2X44_03140 [candidate division CPR3 bacterium GWF2_35_18]|uniref:Phosphoglycerate mutase n=1 Tax=candidate division CPR3 bacterium GW2011_GWF2_35_18 TaxID=1618350 RepID=A0A0G0C094_UNCC3|nr:MAG: Phosphoglycerate mutase [candidate division CPR3 bacterium GW2011_GWF2_35_18]OGB62973.1 MAG: hypothetical protein A2X44_03140 [candidate division CPR3 bacterium GWF2_35_18]OGB65901.1 MAG: hypothetical protein A2250_03250 [candidate division CPR3 bacterium RIFOXYA2_FULL_35_13]OGB76725.1 MAG: hypothetical protein A2476_00430 [candidate division CPR3 bacterium RIFOXYC2_FULL_35_7]OGB78926.1 MAG: hypothetical protein A2296_00040 [candidate division CPR3 bacterium RIFOXYB2_FULL_35_8]
MKDITKTTIFFVRHGETHKGKEIFWSRKPGRSLSQKGIKQIEKAASYLSQFPIIGIFYSPSKRTTQSAIIISESFRHAEITTSKELWEWDQGFNGKRVEGKPFSSFGQEINNVYQSHPTKMIGGETLIEAIQRASGFVNELIFKYEGKFIVCVSHEDVIRGTVLVLQKESLDNLNSIPCVKGSIYKLVFRKERLISVEYIPGFT